MAAAPDQRAYIVPPKHIALLMQESPIFKPIVNTGYNRSGLLFGLYTLF